MARTSSNKTDEMKLPKYLKLAKGTMWMDTIGENCSNVHLYNTTTQFVGRGYISDDAWETFNNDGFIEGKELAKDLNNNESTQHGQYGYVEQSEDKSFFETTDIPKSKLGNIITAFKSGVLVEYDPEAVQKAAEERKIQKNFSYKADGDLVFTGKNKHMFDKLNNSKHDELIAFIKNSPMNAKTNLMDLYDYEMQGFNRLNRPRASVLEAIRGKLNEFGPGMSAISVEKDN